MATNFLNNEMEFYTERIDQIYLNIEQEISDVTYAEIDNIIDRWDSTQLIWSVLIGHEDMEKIELTMNKLKDYNVSSNIVNASLELIELKAVIEHNVNKYNINIKNIF
jgi:hypothetical protein